VTAAHFEANLPHNEDAPGIARRLLAQWLRPVLDPAELQSAELLASELVTNAVVHGLANITMRAQLDEDRLHVEVIDEGGGFEQAIRQADFDSVGGRGLAIVDAEASRWGIHEGTTHVWFELERPGPRLGPAEKPST
jgi:anti-sigma regulatory factor (Ser/Thr protein kinase)